MAWSVQKMHTARARSDQPYRRSTNSPINRTAGEQLEDILFISHTRQRIIRFHFFTLRCHRLSSIYIHRYRNPHSVVMFFGLLFFEQPLVISNFTPPPIYHLAIKQCQGHDVKHTATQFILFFYRQNRTGSCEQTQHTPLWCQGAAQSARETTDLAVLASYSYWIFTKTLIITPYDRCSELVQPSITLCASSVGGLVVEVVVRDHTPASNPLRPQPSANIPESLTDVSGYSTRLSEPLYPQLSHRSISSSCFLSLFSLPFVLLQQQQTANLLAVTKHWLSRGWFHWEALPDMRGALTWLTHTLYCCLIREWGRRGFRGSCHYFSSLLAWSAGKWGGKNTPMRPNGSSCELKQDPPQAVINGGIRHTPKSDYTR